VLLHYSSCWGALCAGREPNGTWRDAWRALEALHREKRIRERHVKGTMKKIIMLIMMMMIINVIITHVGDYDHC